MAETLMQAERSKFVDLFYKEAIGHPFSPSGYTEEYAVLRDVTHAYALRYIDSYNWIRSVWRITPATKETARG